MANWTKEDCLSFARASADSAFADAGYFESLQDSIDCARENIRCTLSEYQASEFEYEAWKIFDSCIAEKTTMERA